MLEIKPRVYHSERQHAPLNPGQDSAKDGVSHTRRATGLVETAEAERLEMYCDLFGICNQTVTWCPSSVVLMLVFDGGI